jgi:hypothetical protein
MKLTVKYHDVLIYIAESELLLKFNINITKNNFHDLKQKPKVLCIII